MENKTAMMQLMNELKQVESQSIMYPHSLDLVYELIEKKYLELEKEQIIVAYEEGRADILQEVHREYGKGY